MSTTNKYYDPCSFSNPNLFIIEHIDLNWNVDFETKTFAGHVRLHFKLTSSATEKDSIVLDTRDLKVESVVEESSNAKLKFQLAETSKSCFGTALSIDLNGVPNVAERKSLVLFIKYETSSNASALQWLGANATCGKKHPYLFSQCQAIHARSIMPCQDTPSVKFTYNAVVSVEKPLVALMSAIPLGNDELDHNRVAYKFEQKIKIPSYLLAIAVGPLVSKQIGPRSKVWTEPEMIEAAAFEFSEIGGMLDDAEKLLGEYVWGTYDLLVLPPTFPYGGMENPNLTFVTPTLLAGDRSLTSVIQHEITHSWTGNLVTNKNWEHFWLNEGFTRFIENKLVGISNKSEKYRQFECIEGWRHLKEDVKTFGEANQLTQLITNLNETDPDDAFSSIPYEKGHTILFYLEELLGGPEVFNKYLKAHIERFKGVSIDSDEWKAFLYEYFNDKKDILDKVDWNGWLNKPGLPPYTPTFDQTLANQVTHLSEKLFNNEITEIDPLYASFSSSQKRELLGQLLDKDAMSVEKLNALNEVYKFSSIQNAEIRFKWLRLSIKAKWMPIIEPALQFLRDQGRMKFTRPVYRDLFAWAEARELAINNFKSEKPFMHQTTAALVEKDLEKQ